MHHISKSMFKSFPFLAALVLFYASLLPGAAWAKTAAELDVGVEATLDRFVKEVKGGGDLLKKANGALVFPSVIKAGVGIGGEYGEGGLVVAGKIVDYYSTASASFGFQLGAQSKSVVIVFLTVQALEKFRNSKGWEAGVDGSVALLSIGAGADVNTQVGQKPIVGFVFNNKGLMYNLTLEGSKFTKLNR